MAAENRDRLLALLLFATLIALAVSGWRPYDRATWLLEVAPVLIALPVLIVTRRSYPLTTLLYVLIFAHALVLILGGVFLLVKGIGEIRDIVKGEAVSEDINTKPVTVFWGVIAQIAVIDIVFSLDSVIAAVGMANQTPVMVAAILLAVAVMLLAATPLGKFIDRNPTVKMLALAFIVLVGAFLIAEGLDAHIPKGYIYFAMGFSAAVESLNLWAKKRAQQRLLPE